MPLYYFEDIYVQQKNVNAQRLLWRSGVGVRSVESELQSKLESRYCVTHYGR